MANHEHVVTLKKYMVLFRSGAGVSCEAANPAAAVQLAKAEQRALGRTKKELKVERVVERTWEDGGGHETPPLSKLQPAARAGA